MTSPSPYAFVDPRHVAELQAHEGPRFLRAMLTPRVLDHPSTRELVDLWRQWAAYVRAPVDVTTAPHAYARGCELAGALSRIVGEDRVSHTTGPIPRAYSAGACAPCGAFAAASSRYATGAGEGIVTPGDVLAYRKIWDDYVMGTARAAVACAAAWRAFAAQAPPATAPNVAQFAVPPDARTLALWAAHQDQIAESITTAWNAHAGKQDYEVVLLASSILADFQNAVLRVGRDYQPQIAHDCPALALPKPPSVEAQKEVVGRIEGLKILAHGVLQIFAIGVDGALETVAQIGHDIEDAGKAASRSLPVVAAIVVGGVLLLALAKK
jgi:hypothetical protein